MDEYTNTIGTPYGGWKVVKKDPVMYRDASTRGLDFVFGMVRAVGQNPLNRLVAVYQKPDDDEGGDFVIVSKSSDNPNDVRIFEITNEWYGDTKGFKPEQLVQKVLEMADDSGMHRNIMEYADYGKTNDILITQGLFDSFNIFKKKTTGEESVKPDSGSLIKNHIGNNKNVAEVAQNVNNQIFSKPEKIGHQEVLQAAMARTQAPAQTGGGMLSGVAKAGVGVFKKINVGTGHRSLDPVGFAQSVKSDYSSGMAGQKTVQDRTTSDMFKTAQVLAKTESSERIQQMKGSQSTSLEKMKGKYGQTIQKMKNVGSENVANIRAKSIVDVANIRAGVGPMSSDFVKVGNMMKQNYGKPETPSMKSSVTFKVADTPFPSYSQPKMKPIQVNYGNSQPKVGNTIQKAKTGGKNRTTK